MALRKDATLSIRRGRDGRHSRMAHHARRSRSSRPIGRRGLVVVGSAHREAARFCSAPEGAAGVLTIDAAGGIRSRIGRNRDDSHPLLSKVRNLATGQPPECSSGCVGTFDALAMAHPSYPPAPERELLLVARRARQKLVVLLPACRARACPSIITAGSDRLAWI